MSTACLLCDGVLDSASWFGLYSYKKVSWLCAECLFVTMSHFVLQICEAGLRIWEVDGNFSLIEFLCMQCMFFLHNWLQLIAVLSQTDFMLLPTDSIILLTDSKQTDSAYWYFISISMRQRRFEGGCWLWEVTHPASAHLWNSYFTGNQTTSFLDIVAIMWSCSQNHCFP